MIDRVPPPDDLLPAVRRLFEREWAASSLECDERPRDDEPIAGWIERTGGGGTLNWALLFIAGDAEIAWPAHAAGWWTEVAGISAERAKAREDARFEDPDWLDVPPVGPWNVVTPADLHRYVAERTPRDRFDPLEIAGHVDPAAGAFLGIRSLVGRLRPGVRCGPSSRLRDCLSPIDVQRLWTRLAWRFGVAPPPLRAAAWWWSGGVWVLIYTAFLIALFLVGRGLPLPAFMTAHFAGVGLVCGCHLLGRERLRPPKGIHTFRDLAERLATLHD